MKTIIFICLVLIAYIIIEWAKNDYINPLILFNQSRIANYIDSKLNLLYDKKILKLNRKQISAVKVVLLSIIMYLISVIILYFYIKVLSTSVILSVPFLISPLILSKVLLERNKQKIIRSLPFYAINIKNQMKDENNIIQAMKKAKVDKPLNKYIEDFLSSVFNGANVLKAFNKLKNDVDVKDFTELINSFEVCYKNGGDFILILEKYILIKSKERLQKEEIEEKAFSSIMILAVMTVLNIVVIITFVFGNQEYAMLIRNTVIGRGILNLNVIIYIIGAMIIFKVYKEE